MSTSSLEIVSLDQLDAVVGGGRIARKIKKFFKKVWNWELGGQEPIQDGPNEPPELPYPEYGG